MFIQFGSQAHAKANGCTLARHVSTTEESNFSANFSTAEVSQGAGGVQSRTHGSFPESRIAPRPDAAYAISNVRVARTPLNSEETESERISQDSD